LRSIVAIDPGTIHTGIVKCDVSEEGGIVRVTDSSVLEVPKGVAAPKRINAILEQVVQWVDNVPFADEVWIEQFMFYGARKGAMHNAALVGALAYLPATRQRDDLTTFVVPPVTWKSWYYKPFRERQVSECEVIRERLEEFGLLDTDLYSSMLHSQHIADAVGIALYSQYGDPNVDQTSPA